MAIHGENTPEIANSYVCGQHLRGGRRQKQDDVPSIFIGKKVVKERTSRTSQSSVIARVVPKPSDLEQGAEVGARVKKVNPATVIPHLIILLTNLGSPQK